MNNKDYVNKLEKTLAKFLEPVKDIPFSVAIKVISGYQVLSVDRNEEENKKLLRKLVEAAEISGKESFQKGIVARRANEVGNKIEPFVKKALVGTGLIANTPKTKEGTRKATGYPDIEIQDKNGRIIYLECKTYNLKNVGTTQRAFYFSPAKRGCKITSDAYHLIMSFQIDTVKRQNKLVYVPVHWKILTTEDLIVQLKHEFNASNRDLYRKEFLLAEGCIKK